MTDPLFFAFVSTIIFSFSSIIYSQFASKFSANWMNAFKAMVATFAFAIVSLFEPSSFQAITWEVFLLLFVGGFIGLNLGDFFLLKAFQRIGAARTLMVFSFQPFFMAFFAYIFFSQSLNWQQWVAVFLMVLCVLNISYEKFRTRGGWEIWGPLFALIGVFLDCLGVIMTREAFERDASLSVVAANLYRCLGAGVGFIFISYFFPFQMWKRFGKLRSKTKALIVSASFVGTFLALYFYLMAVEKGHLGKIAAIVGSGPLFTAVFECWIKKEWPSRYLWISLSLFSVAFWILTSSK